MPTIDEKVNAEICIDDDLNNIRIPDDGMGPSAAKPIGIERSTNALRITIRHIIR
jgi:hypothetical protein